MKLYSPFVGISNNIKLIYKISFIVIVFSYLIFHSINGENGLFSYVKIKNQVESQREKLESLKDDLKNLKQRVNLLGNKSLDLDILEERCRIVLNYCYPDEVVIREKTILSN